MARERSNAPAYLEAVAGLVKAMIGVFLHELKNKRYNANFFAAMTWAFQPDSSLHKYHYQISDDELKRLRTSHQTWRKELQPGDKVDVRVKADEKSTLTGWNQAKINAIEGD
jgi:hypothetical protein